MARQYSCRYRLRASFQSGRGAKPDSVSLLFSKRLLNSILIFMSYSLIMSIIWILLESPDLAITEAAVGAGVTSVLFFATLKKIHAMREEDEEKDE